MAERRKGRVTLQDIAQASGTSVATVSLVLNGRWQQNRISPDTAEKVQELARSLSYMANDRARALRLSRSGLAGMIVPHYRNRLFTGLVEVFEATARARGLCPLIASTQRDPRIEAEAVQSLLRQDVEFLFLVGITEAAPLVKACEGAGVRVVAIDLPGQGVPSVVTDNRAGARLLTHRIRDRMRVAGCDDPEELWFIGGVPGEFASEERYAGFLEIAGRRPAPGLRDHLCGYRPEDVRAALEAIHDRLGRLPHGLFVNSSPAFEALAGFLMTLDLADYGQTSFGCFDWDPLGSWLPSLAGMIRHDVQSLVAAAFRIIDDPESVPAEVQRIAPLLVEANPARAP